MFDYKKDEQSINHVHCDVKNCIHNGHNCNCTAKEIKVGPHQACSRPVKRLSKRLSSKSFEGFVSGETA